MSRYEEDFYRGMPVLTRNHYGSGTSYYVGTRSNEEFYLHFLKNVFQEAGVEPVMNTPKGVEAAVRVNEKGRTLFLINHEKESSTVVLDRDCRNLVDGKVYRSGDCLELKKKEVVILRS